METASGVHTGLIAVIHIAPLIGIYLPLINVLIPVIFWLLKKDEDPAYDEQGRKIINFQLTISLAAGLSLVALVVFFPAGYPMLMGCYLYAIVLAGINAVKTLKGSKVSYPMSIPFLKLREQVKS